jgi:hypothetical protein
MAVSRDGDSERDERLVLHHHQIVAFYGEEKGQRLKPCCPEQG